MPEGAYKFSYDNFVLHLSENLEKGWLSDETLNGTVQGETEAQAQTRQRFQAESKKYVSRAIQQGLLEECEPVNGTRYRLRK